MNARQFGHIRRVSICLILQPVQADQRRSFCYNRRSRIMKTEREHRDEIVQIGRLVFEKGWVAANDGNISIRLDDERILATPTGMCKGMMQPDDLIVIDRKGHKISGRREKTTEI